jgi:hypothetical protein
MKLLRLALLLFIVAAAYFAQYLLDYRSLGEFFPAWLLAVAPGFQRFTRWLPEDLLDLALWLSIGSAIGFGLLAPVWRGEPVLRGGSGLGPSGRLRSGMGWTIRAGLGLSIASAVVCIVLASLGAGETAVVAVFWLAALILLAAVYTVVDAVMDAVAAVKGQAERADPAPVARPMRGWPILLLILGAAAAAYLYDLIRAPIRVDAAVAEAGLQALSLLNGAELRLFDAGQGFAPMIAYLPLAAAMAAAGDGLLGMRWMGTLAALATVIGTWLVGCELFRRTPVLGEYGEILEDDGQWMALAAAALAAGQTATFYFARLPLYLVSVAWGTLGAWLMLRGMRRRSRLNFALAGILAGLASITSPGGVAFVAIGLIWWAGMRLLVPAWLAERRTSATPRFRRSLWPWLACWAGGLLIFLAPFVGTWLHRPAQLGAYLYSNWGSYPSAQLATASFERATAQAAVESPLLLEQERPDNTEVVNPLWVRLRQTVLAFDFYPDQSEVFGFDGHWLHSLLAPLLLLALGALLLSLDRPIGWLLMTWLATAVVVAGILSPVAPFWPLLLPALPAAALAIAFGFDRLRVTWLETAGTWALHATIYLAAGVVVGAGLLSWVGFYQFASADVDLPSIVGRGLRTMEAGRAVVLVDPAGDLERALREPAAAFLDNGRLGERAVVPVTPPAWPEQLPAGARLLVAPWTPALLVEAELRYPGGRASVMRNRQGDPLLYIYDLAP